jgi:hypothetical protein
VEQSGRIFVLAHAGKLGRETGILLSPWTAQFQTISDATPRELQRAGIPA